MSQLTITDEEKMKYEDPDKPALPFGRPPTRKEVWDYCVYWYGDLKDEDELRAWAKEHFVGNYVYAVNFNGWTKPPDWKEGEPVVAEACPRRPFPAVPTSVNAREVYRLMELQKGGS